jgi:hypothetical protein
VSFLDGGGESVKVRGAGGRGNKCSFFIKYEDPSQWRDEGEGGDAFIRAFTEKAEAQARDTFATIVSKAKRARSPSIGAEDDDAPDAKRTRSSSVGAENDDAPEEAHVPRYPTLPAPPPRRTHFGSSQTPHTFVRFVLLLSETNGGAGWSASSLRDFSVQASEGQPCAALLALSRVLFGRCSLSLIQLYECACVCVFSFIFFLLLAVFL